MLLGHQDYSKSAKNEENVEDGVHRVHYNGERDENYNYPIGLHFVNLNEQFGSLFTQNNLNKFGKNLNLSKNNSKNQGKNQFLINFVNSLDIFGLNPIAYIILSPSQYTVHHYNSLKRLLTHNSIFRFNNVFLPLYYNNPISLLSNEKNCEQNLNNKKLNKNDVFYSQNLSTLFLTDFDTPRSTLQTKSTEVTYYPSINLTALFFLSTFQRFSMNYQRILQCLVDFTSVSFSENNEKNNNEKSDNEKNDKKNSNSNSNTLNSDHNSLITLHFHHDNPHLRSNQTHNTTTSNNMSQLQPHWRTKISSWNIPSTFFSTNSNFLYKFSFSLHFSQIAPSQNTQLIK
jgi:hypothetical protein